MKNSNILKCLLLTSSFLLTSCGTQISYKDHLSDYVKEMNYTDDFTILQLTDIHWSSGTPTFSCKEYITNLIEEVKTHNGGKNPDLIELTGDMFMLSNAYTANDFLTFMEGLGIPYTTIWGNHDREGTYNPNWLSNKFMNAKNSIYIEPEDDLYGRSNFVINLKDGDKIVWQIANLDSGASYTEDGTNFKRTYDYIHEDQANWWKMEHDLTNNAPTIAFYHIPQYDIEAAYDEIQNGASLKNKFFKLEGIGNNKTTDSDGNRKIHNEFFNVAKENNVKACIFGHDHSDDWTVDYQGITLSFGVKTGYELYYEKVSEEEAAKQGINEAFDLSGASLITLHNDETFKLEHLYYNERTSGNFVKWLEY